MISLYGFLAAEDEELACPVIVRRHHVREHQRLPRPVPEEDLRRFFAVIIDKRDLAMFLLMLRCGLRIGEVAALQLADLFLDEDYPRIVARGKGSRERGVYLSRQAETAMGEYLAERPQVASEFVFLSYLEEGLSTTSIHNRLLKYREEAGIQITAHRLRHSFANDLLNADAAITSIQKLMGHRWIESTQNYVIANDKQVCADYYAACAKLEGWTDAAYNPNPLAALTSPAQRYDYALRLWSWEAVACGCKTAVALRTLAPQTISNCSHVMSAGCQAVGSARWSLHSITFPWPGMSLA